MKAVVFIFLTLFFCSARVHAVETIDEVRDFGRKEAQMLRTYALETIARYDRLKGDAGKKPKPVVVLPKEFQTFGVPELISRQKPDFICIDAETFAIFFGVLEGRFCQLVVSQNPKVAEDTARELQKHNVMNLRLLSEALVDGVYLFLHVPN